LKITRNQLREMVKQHIDERCQKGYKTDEKRKTKKMYGKTYRNCVKAESEEPAEGETLEERAAIPYADIERAQEIIKTHLGKMFDEIGREDLPKRFSLDTLVNTILQRYVDARKANVKTKFNPLTGRNTRRSIRP
jgi:uncharacterized membrane-anchored protein YjiN (DUF445 family)